jgi:hypothetical protein
MKLTDRGTPLFLRKPIKSTLVGRGGPTSVLFRLDCRERRAAGGDGLSHRPLGNFAQQISQLRSSGR